MQKVIILAIAEVEADIPDDGCIRDTERRIERIIEEALSKGFTDAVCHCVVTRTEYL